MEVPASGMLTLILESSCHSPLPESHLILQDPALAKETWTEMAVCQQQGQTAWDLMCFLLLFWQLQIPALEGHIPPPIQRGLRGRYIKEAVFPK